MMLKTSTEGTAVTHKPCL